MTVSIGLSLVLIFTNNSIVTSDITAMENEDMRITMKDFNVVISFIQVHNTKLSYDDAYKIAYISFVESRASVIPWTLLIAQQKVESHFDANAVSKKHAKGISQIIHDQWDWYEPYNQIINSESDLLILEKAISAQVVILERFLDKHHGNMWRAIRNYCGSYSTETRDYVQEVLKYKSQLDRQIGMQI